MLKRRVTESTLDTYASRMRPADLAASAFHSSAGRPADANTANNQHSRPEGAQPPQLLGR